MAVKKRIRKNRGEQGQATVEYVLLLAIIMVGVGFAASKLGDLNLPSKLGRPLNENFARTYRYGHPKAKGYDDGGPAFHPRATDAGGQNFRIFINPGRQ